MNTGKKEISEQMRELADKLEAIEQRPRLLVPEANDIWEKTYDDYCRVLVNDEGSYTHLNDGVLTTGKGSLFRSPEQWSYIGKFNEVYPSAIK